MSGLKNFQRLYAIAFVYFVFIVVFDQVPVNIHLVSGIAFIALASELWPIFVKVWHSLLGRFSLITTYLIVGNFAFVTASHKLNGIIGADPTPLVYSRWFATLLMAPVWMLTVTILLMLFYFLFLQIWLLARLILRGLRLRLSDEKAGLKYPLSTAIVKIILLPVMFYSAALSIEFYASLLSDVEVSVVSNRLEQATSADTSMEEADGGKSASETHQEEKTPINIDTIIADFVYHFDVYGYSQCKKEATQRAVFVGETDVLLVKPSDNSYSGYEFVVKPCELTNKAHTTLGLSSSAPSAQEAQPEED